MNNKERKFVTTVYKNQKQNYSAVNNWVYIQKQKLNLLSWDIKTELLPIEENSTAIGIDRKNKKAVIYYTQQTEEMDVIEKLKTI
tara:strand:+ start:589 stop:843 length:255 start_codon:yes stop_codon:yes gene_type:complete